MQFYRLQSKRVEKALSFFPAILITGARQVGKSTLAKTLGIANYITLDNLNHYLSASNDPIGFITSLKKPVIIDEIQKLPELLRVIKEDIDNARENGQYVLTGSSNIMTFGKIGDTLAGRIAIFELFPLSAVELEDSRTNLIDLLLDGDSFDTKSRDELGILEAIMKGGYPELQKITDKDNRSIWLSSYIATYIERDVRDIGEIRDLDAFRRVIALIAPLSGSIINSTDISKIARVNQKTLENHLSLLKAIYQITELKPYFKNIQKQSIKSPKIYMNDSAVLCHLLNINDIKKLKSSEYFGMVLESYIFSEILKNISVYEDRVGLYYYRTLGKDEIDFIIEVDDKIIAIEVKSTKTANLTLAKTIKEFKKDMGEHFLKGYIFYLGDEIVRIEKDIIFLPIGKL